MKTREELDAEVTKCLLGTSHVKETVRLGFEIILDIRQLLIQLLNK